LRVGVLQTRLMDANPDNSGMAAAADAARGQLKTCPACGAEFGCKSPSTDCWCGGLKLSERALADLEARYSGCLCPQCLAQVAERDAVK
jgi:Cysteine-rich CWC